MNDSEHDAQHRVFAELDGRDLEHAADLVGDATLRLPDDPHDSPIRTPEEWDADGWDSDRQPPKTIAEAKAALDARIATDDAPDAPEHAGAYDRLES